MMTDTQTLGSLGELAPWQPAPTAIPATGQHLIQDLSAQARGTPHVYVLNTPYDAQGVGDLLRFWGLSLPAVLAGYLMEYDSKLIQDSGMPEFSEIIRHIQEATHYARDIEEEYLHNLLTLPYRDLDALLLAVATYYQALKLLQAQSNGRPYAGNTPLRIESVGRTLLNISKRLGMWHFKRQVEDITEQLRDPVKFKEDQQEYLDILKKDHDALEHIQQLLAQSYEQVTHQPVVVIQNPCSTSGLKRRMQDAHITATSHRAQLSGFDLVRFDVIVPTVKDCYLAFGIFSQMGVIQDHVTDLIANPKPNGSSYIAFGLILTTQYWPEHAIQFQISTPVMQTITNYGCLYPQYRSCLEAGQQIKVASSELNGQGWNHQDGRVFQTLQNQLASSVISNEKPVVVYDKSRRPVALPVNATALDFAYALGKDVGDIAVEAIVNNRKAPLYRQLEAGDIVEIRTARQTQANEAWLDYAVTPTAKQEIKAADIYTKAVRKGYSKLLSVLKRYHCVLTLRELDEELRLLFRRHKELSGSQEKFLERIAANEREHEALNWAAQEIMKQLSDRSQELVQMHDSSLWIPLVDPHLPKKLVYNEKRICGQCRPSYPRDEKIIGRLRKRGGTLIVHKETCAHLIDRPSGRHSMLVPMSWQPQPPAFRIAFRVMVQDRRGLIFDLARHLRHPGCELIAITAEAASPRTGIGHIYFTIETHSDKEVLDIWEDVYSIENIVEVMIDTERTPSSICERMNTLYQNRETLASKTVIEFTWEEALHTLPPRRLTLSSPFDIARPPGPKMFFGRSEETRTMWRELCEDKQGRALVLYGPRRSGKSSICHNFLASQVYAPNLGVLFSLQNAVRDTEAEILKQLAERISDAFHEQLGQSAPAWDDFQESDPQIRFRQLLQACFKRVADTRLVLALDEFGGAIEAFNADFLDLRFFTYWKELITEVPQLSLIVSLPTSAHYHLCSDRLAPAFNFAQTLPMSFLDTESAKRLLADPLREQGIAIHPNTVARAVTLTGGSPYYLALIGNELIAQLNREVSKQVVSDKTLKMVIDRFIESGAFQNFEFLRSELQDREEFAILETMIDYMGRSNQAEMQLMKIASLAQMRVPIARRNVDRLRTGLILDENGPSSNPFYSFKIELVRRWLTRNRWFFAVDN